MNGKISERSFEPITKADLERLADIAEADRVEFFTNYPEYRARMICVALCQGAALHYIHGNNGVKDFDVWTFYDRDSAKKPFYPLRRKSWDFGPSKFGKMLNDLPEAKDFLGRRVDLLGRSLKVGTSPEPVAVLRRYLTEGKSESARWLSQKAVVLLEPRELLGTVVWPTQPSRSGLVYEQLMPMSGQKCYTLTADKAAEMIALSRSLQACCKSSFTSSVSSAGRIFLSRLGMRTLSTGSLPKPFAVTSKIRIYLPSVRGSDSITASGWGI